MKHYIVPFIVTAVFIIMDYCTGIANATMHNQISSKIMRKGLWHKFSYIVVISTAFLIEYGSQWLELGFNLPIVTPVLVSVCLIEVTSILENCTKINPELKKNKVLNIFSEAQNEKINTWYNSHDNSTDHDREEH